MFFVFFVYLISRLCVWILTVPLNMCYVDLAFLLVQIGTYSVLVSHLDWLSILNLDESVLCW